MVGFQSQKREILQALESSLDSTEALSSLKWL